MTDTDDGMIDTAPGSTPVAPAQTVVSNEASITGGPVLAVHPTQTLDVGGFSAASDNLPVQTGTELSVEFGIPTDPASTSMTRESPQEPPLVMPSVVEFSPSHGTPPSIGDDAGKTIAGFSSGTENETEQQPKPSEASTIYVDYSVPATLRYSETSVFYLTLREAITAWLALPNETKKDASIATNENSGAHYYGWEIYRLWGRWNC